MNDENRTEKSDESKQPSHKACRTRIIHGEPGTGVVVGGGRHRLISIGIHIIKIIRPRNPLIFTTGIPLPGRAVFMLRQGQVDPMLFDARLSSFTWELMADVKCKYSFSFPDDKVRGPTWGPPGSCRPQMGPMLAPWNLLSSAPFY